MNTQGGTPPNIGASIANALNELWPGTTHDGSPWIGDSHEVQTIIEHIRERVAQDFGTAVMKAAISSEDPDKLILDLFSKIFPKEG